jgi:hypothetical protein
LVLARHVPSAIMLAPAVIICVITPNSIAKQEFAIIGGVRKVSFVAITPAAVLSTRTALSAN